MKANTQVIIGVILIFLALILTPIRLQSGISIIADSGLPEDIQTAVNEAAAAGGGTVYIPEGTFLWNASSFSQTFWGRPTGVIIPGGVNVIGAGADKTVLKVVERAPDNALMFGVDGEGKSVRISGIHFIGYVVDETENIGAIRIVDGKDFRVDHCIFENFDGSAITTRKQTATATHRGVIDHNVFDNPYKLNEGHWVWGYGIIVIAYGGIYDVIWKPIDEYLGKYEDNVVYIEDNEFHRCRHAIASNEGGYYVARYNLFDEPYPKNFGMVDVHGAASDTVAGGRGLEAYENTLVGAEGYSASQAFWIRGGSGVIFNNTMRNILYGVTLERESVEEGWVKDLYIWGNVMDGGTLIQNNGDYIEGEDYFLFEKPGYTPYPYPHPLTLGEEPPMPNTFPVFEAEAEQTNKLLKQQGRPHIITKLTFEQANVTVISIALTNDTLAIVLDGVGVVNLMIYCGGYGKPNQIKGAVMISYNNSTQILIIQVEFHSLVTVELYWGTSLEQPPPEESVPPSEEPLQFEGEFELNEMISFIQISLLVIGGVLIIWGAKRREK